MNFKKRIFFIVLTLPLPVLAAKIYVIYLFPLRHFCCITNQQNNIIEKVILKHVYWIPYCLDDIFKRPKTLIFGVRLTFVFLCPLKITRQRNVCATMKRLIHVLYNFNTGKIIKLTQTMNDCTKIIAINFISVHIRLTAILEPPPQ